MAAQEGHLEVVRCLCEAGASESTVTNSGETAIDAASRSGHDNIANFLLKKMLIQSLRDEIESLHVRLGDSNVV